VGAARANHRVELLPRAAVENHRLIFFSECQNLTKLGSSFESRCGDAHLSAEYPIYPG
jgi:hypothetical protein